MRLENYVVFREGTSGMSPVEERYGILSRMRIGAVHHGRGCENGCQLIKVVGADRLLCNEVERHGKPLVGSSYSRQRV